MVSCGLVWFNMEHGPFMDDLPVRNGDLFLIVMLNYQRVIVV